MAWVYIEARSQSFDGLKIIEIIIDFLDDGAQEAFRIAGVI